MTEADQTNTTPPLDRYAKAAATRRKNKAKRAAIFAAQQAAKLAVQQDGPNFAETFDELARLWAQRRENNKPGNVVQVPRAVAAQHRRAQFCLIETPPPADRSALDILIAINRKRIARERRAQFRVVGGTDANRERPHDPVLAALLSARQQVRDMQFRASLQPTDPKGAA